MASRDNPCTRCGACCAIHEWRPSRCREFGLRALLGIGDGECDRARGRLGLPPLRG